jgi:hypothetical protein
VDKRRSISEIREGIITKSISYISNVREIIFVLHGDYRIDKLIC